jgi:peptidoglycan lytic transglycosylase
MVRLNTFCVAALLASFVLSLSPASAMGPKRFHEGETQRGLASWYGLEQGRQTSSGERFDPHKLTAAHRHLPFGTIVRVTNRANGLTVDVRINDRGPWGDGDRIIDLSSAAADVLQMKKSGLIPVEIEVIDLPSPGQHD